MQHLFPLEVYSLGLGAFPVRRASLPPPAPVPSPHRGGGLGRGGLPRTRPRNWCHKARSASVAFWRNWRAAWRRVMPLPPHPNPLPPGEREKKPSREREKYPLVRESMCITRTRGEGEKALGGEGKCPLVRASMCITRLQERAKGPGYVIRMTGARHRFPPPTVGEG